MRRILVILVVVSACHGKRAGKDFFGTQVSPPGVLAQIRPGMTVAQVKAIAPDAKDDPGKGLLLGKPAGNVKLYAITDRDLVEYTYADYAGDDGIAVLTQAWGPPDKEPDRSDLHDVAWRSTSTGWRASVFCGNGTETTKIPPFCTIKFHPHLPLEMMFGKTLVPPGELAKATPRMTVAQLKAATHLASLTDAPAQVPMRWLDYDGAVEHVSIVEGRLYSLDYTLPSAARPAIEKAWGPPVQEGDHSIWFDAHTGWSATLETSAADPNELRLEFQGYQPFATIVDLLEKLTAAPTVTDAQRQHPELEWEPEKAGASPVLYTACNEFTDPTFRVGKLELVAFFGDSKALQAVMGHLDPAREAAIVDVLTKRWGAPVKAARGNEIEYRFGKHGVLIRLGTSLSLQVETAA